jgi:hypothetical protein
MKIDLKFILEKKDLLIKRSLINLLNRIKWKRFCVDISKGLFSESSSLSREKGTRLKRFVDASLYA